MTLGYDISDVSHTVYGSTSSMSAGDAGNATTSRERTFHEINPGDWRTSGVPRRSRWENNDWLNRATIGGVYFGPS